MRSLQLLTLSFCLLALGSAATGTARAQGVARELGSPEPDADHEDDASVAVPAPPGAAREPEDDVRYPIPTPLDVAQRSDESEPSVRISSRVTTRLRALDANLRSLAARGGGNVVNAVLSLLTGGLAITLGALKDPNDDAMSIYLYVYGGAAAARGILDLVLTPNAEGAAITYQHLPMTTRGEVEERILFGERALAGLAEQSLIARVLDASLNMAAGIAVVPIYLAPNDFEITDPLDYFILIGAGVSVVSGIITLVSTSAAEQRWSAYQELRERRARERDSERDSERDEAAAVDDAVDPIDEDELAMPWSPVESWRVAFAPTPNGGFAGLTVRM